MLSFVGTVDNRSSFLTDYVRGQIEWDNQSAPGSGDGSLFLSKGNDSYILRSYFNNGVPSGEAILMKDNVVVSKLSLQDGKRSGICSLNDEEGYLMFRGSYVNDQKQGYGITYNKGSQILTGYYNDDQLSSILFQFNERRMEVSSKGMLQFIGDFDQGNLSRTGIGYLYADGHIQSIYDYDNKRQLALFDIQKMRIFDEHGDVVYEGEYLNSFEAGYPRHGKGKHLVSSKETYRGQFVNGEYEGEGTLYIDNQPRYKGSWTHNHANGKGVLFNAYGEVIEDIISFESDYGRTKKGIWIDIRTLEATRKRPSSSSCHILTPKADPPEWWLTSEVRSTLDRYFMERNQEFDFNIHVKKDSFSDSNVDVVPTGSDKPVCSNSSGSPQSLTGITSHRPSSSTRFQPLSANKPLQPSSSTRPLKGSQHEPLEGSLPQPSPPPRKATIRSGAELNKLSYNMIMVKSLQQLTLMECTDHYYTRFDVSIFEVLESLTILKESCTCLGSLIVSHLPLLKSITIGVQSCRIEDYGGIRKISFTDLPSLTTLDIGDYCFNNHETVIFQGKMVVVS
ncbi:hypothetical protein WA171_005278 [Blastocystis sp. BT1]